jgi:anti-sigma B factor antagonist
MASELLDLQVTPTAGYAVVEVAGEVDVASAPELRDCLQQTIDAGSRQLVVDLRRISFIDSVGLGVLVGAQRRLRRHGHDGGVHLVVAEGLVLRVLRVTGLDRVFPLHATLTDALSDDAG